MKRCPRCRRTTDDFQVSRTRPDGLQIYCRPCRRRVDRESYARNERTRKRLRQKANTEKGRARSRLGYAVRHGHITKPDHCERCSQPTPKHKLHGHHQDYSKPLEVEWLCNSCHVAEHSRSG